MKIRAWTVLGILSVSGFFFSPVRSLTIDTWRAEQTYFRAFGGFRFRASKEWGMKITWASKITHLECWWQQNVTEIRSKNKKPQMKSLWWNSHGLLIVFERWWLGMYPWHLITNSNMGWKTGCFANRILRWIGQGIVKVKWWSSPDGFKLERWKLYLTDLTGCKLWTLRCKKKESRRVLPFFESVLKPRTVLGSIFSTALILVFGTVGVAQNCHSFCSVPPWLFGKSGGSMSFIDFTVGVVFFSRWDVRQVDVVPSHVQNLWQWWRWSYWKRGWFSRKQQRSGLWTHFHGWLKLGLSKHITAFLAWKHHDSGKAQSKPWWFY